ncbi:MAG: DUF5058 family protein [Lachnospiraceae bacterium]|nr:DUF5058 family protein [Lachnospiraceae bacterium]
MENIMSLANSTIMWVFALLIIAVAVLQSVVLYRMARKYVNQTGVLTNEEIKVCMRSGGIVAVGPAVSVFVVALSMISMLGAPFTLMRVGMIGSASTELTAASIGAEAAGVTLGVDTLTGAAFTASLWCCAVMSAGYLIFVPFVTRGIGKALNKVIVPEEGKKRSVLSWLISSLLPFVIFLALSYIQAKKSLPHTISLIFAAILMLGINIAAEKSGKKWLRQWAMAFSVLGGIVIGALSNALL